MESPTITHSSADWWDLFFPWHRHPIEGTNGFFCLIRKTLAKRGKRNCQSSEAKSFYRSGTRTFDRPVAGRCSNPLGHRAPVSCCLVLPFPWCLLIHVFISHFKFLASHFIFLASHFIFLASHFIFLPSHFIFLPSHFIFLASHFIFLPSHYLAFHSCVLFCRAYVFTSNTGQSFIPEPERNTGKSSAIDGRLVKCMNGRGWTFAGEACLCRKRGWLEPGHVQVSPARPLITPWHTQHPPLTRWLPLSISKSLTWACWLSLSLPSCWLGWGWTEIPLTHYTSFSCYRLQPVAIDRDLLAGREFSPLTHYNGKRSNWTHQP